MLRLHKGHPKLANHLFLSESLKGFILFHSFNIFPNELEGDVQKFDEKINDVLTSSSRYVSVVVRSFVYVNVILII